jgi:hypothetical protein
MAASLRKQSTVTRNYAGAAQSKKPALTLAASRGRRWPALLGGFALLVVLAGMLGAAVFHTQLAERQLRIGQLERSVNDERERFDELRYRRAELRSPMRLAGAAGELGMVRGDTGTFVELDKWATARQLAAAGVIDNSSRQVIIDTDPLEQFSDVKRVSAGQP